MTGQMRRWLDALIVRAWQWDRSHKLPKDRTAAVDEIIAGTTEELGHPPGSTDEENVARTEAEEVADDLRKKLKLAERELELLKARLARYRARDRFLKKGNVVPIAVGKRDGEDGGHLTIHGSSFRKDGLWIWGEVFESGESVSIRLGK